MSGSLTIATNANNDIYLDSSGNLAMLSGVAGLQSICTGVLQGQLREQIYNWSRGMPTMDTVFRQKNVSAFVAAGRALLLTVPGVVSVQSFTASIIPGNPNASPPTKTQLQFAAQILTIYSPTLVTITSQGV